MLLMRDFIAGNPQENICNSVDRNRTGVIRSHHTCDLQSKDRSVSGALQRRSQGCAPPPGASLERSTGQGKGTMELDLEAFSVRCGPLCLI